MNDITKIASRLHALKHMREELDDEIEMLQDQLKAEMTARNTEVLNVGDYKVSWTSYERTSIDTKKLRKDMPNIAQLYTTTQTLKRFSIT